MSRQKRKTADWAAALVVLVFGGPLLAVGAFAFSENYTRLRRDEPRRGLLGSAAFEAFRAGRPFPEHYLGNHLRAPDFSLPMEDGSTWRLSDHRGRVLVMNMWTVTCGPCLEEMPSLIELAERVARRDDIDIVSISVDSDWSSVHRAVPAGSPLPVLLDPDREVVRGRFGTRLFPETWILDAEGVIRLRVDGARDWSSALAMDAIETFL